MNFQFQMLLDAGLPHVVAGFFSPTSDSVDRNLAFRHGVRLRTRHETGSERDIDGLGALALQCMSALSLEPRAEDHWPEIDTIAELEALPEDEMVSGYTSELMEVPPGSTRAWVHGWKNRQVDLHRRPNSRAQRRLVSLFIERSHQKTLDGASHGV